MQLLSKTSLSIAAILLIVFAFITGLTVKFYASFLFLFYSFTENMVISVILLGVFQTLVLAPIRIINMRQASDIETIKKEVDDIENKDKKYTIFRGYLDAGNVTTLLYSVSFYIQLVSFISIGRLFLTDFYTTKLSENALFSFVPYPNYPLQETIYSFPYIAPTQFIDSGWIVLILIWAAIIIMKIIASYTFRELLQKYGEAKLQSVQLNPIIQSIITLFSEYSLLLMIIAWIGVKYFPVAWESRLFTGDLTVPNTSFNTITATVTFLTVLWLNRNPIKEKLNTLTQAGLNQLALDKEKNILWKSAIINALLIALAAFFMTNQIPSAFELSVFTLEIIAFATPFTLDPLIKKAQQKNK